MDSELAAPALPWMRGQGQVLSSAPHQAPEGGTEPSPHSGQKPQGAEDSAFSAVCRASRRGAGKATALGVLRPGGQCAWPLKACSQGSVLFQGVLSPPRPTRAHRRCPPPSPNHRPRRLFRTRCSCRPLGVCPSCQLRLCVSSPGWLRSAPIIPCWQLLTAHLPAASGCFRDCPASPGAHAGVHLVALSSTAAFLHGLCTLDEEQGLLGLQSQEEKQSGEVEYGAAPRTPGQEERAGRLGEVGAPQLAVCPGPHLDIRLWIQTEQA